MADLRQPITPNPPRWKPNPNPASIEIPELDTSASILDQIEQIDQLITVRLQNVDENFSLINNVLSNGILPELRRYAAATEPVREAAKFWASFYEHAAQVRIPTYSDASVLDDSTNEEEEEQSDTTQRPGHVDDSIVSSSSNASFQPGQALYASTPATTSRPRTQIMNDPSWSATLESPVDRLSREIEDLGRETQDLSRFLPSAVKSTKGKEPLIRNLFRQNLEDVSFSSAAPSPTTIKKPLAVPKHFNPYLAPEAKSNNWNGVVDLKSAPLSTPNRHRARAHKNRTAVPLAIEDDDDDSFLELPPGMSPPRVMSPALGRPSIFHLGKTPLKEAAARISKDLVQKERGTSRVFSREPYDTTSSTLPTPLSFGRNTSSTDSEFTTNDSSLESMMRRATTNLAGLDAPTSQEDYPSHIQRHLVDDNLLHPPEIDSDSDSEDDGAGFVVAQPSVEDSFSSESSTSSASASMVHEGMVEVQQYYQQPVEDYGDDDSFSDDGMVGDGGDTDTIFGGVAVRLQNPAAGNSEGHLSLMGNDLDTLQFGNRLHVRLNPYASQESPTAYRK